MWLFNRKNKRKDEFEMEEPFYSESVEVDSDSDEEAYHQIADIISGHSERIRELLESYFDNPDLLIEELITFFLYFEFIALIVKYFKNNFHFPLDFFLYIGITALVRLLIIDHESALDMLLWSISILVLVCCLVLVERFLNNKE